MKYLIRKGFNIGKYIWFFDAGVLC